MEALLPARVSTGHGRPDHFTDLTDCIRLTFWRNQSTNSISRLSVLPERVVAFCPAAAFALTGLSLEPTSIALADHCWNRASWHPATRLPRSLLELLAEGSLVTFGVLSGWTWTVCNTPIGCFSDPVCLTIRSVRPPLLDVQQQNRLSYFIRINSCLHFFSVLLLSE